jgi:antitoxin component YwqK of YwqJK toxin-antitoxin module
MKKQFLITLLSLLTISAVFAQQTNKTDSIGRKQGIWKKIKGDTLIYEGQFRNDIPYGEFKYYYPDKKIKSTVKYSENGLIARTIVFHTNGKKMAAGMYHEKKKDSTWNYFDKNEVRIFDEFYENGIKSGVWHNYYNDGKIKEYITYSNDKKHGLWMIFYTDSILKAKAIYADGEFEGVFQSFHLNGKLYKSGKFEKGLKEGIWLFYTENNIPFKRETYKNDNLVKQEVAVTDTTKKLIYLDITNIAYLYVADGKLIFVMNDGGNIITNEKIEMMALNLDDFKFFQVNSRYIVSLWAVKEKKNFNKENPVIVLNPKPQEEVMVKSEFVDGFMFWAGINMLPPPSKEEKKQ